MGGVLLYALRALFLRRVSSPMQSSILPSFHSPFAPFLYPRRVRISSNSSFVNRDCGLWARSNRSILCLSDQPRVPTFRFVIGVHLNPFINQVPKSLLLFVLSVARQQHAASPLDLRAKVGR